MIEFVKDQKRVPCHDCTCQVGEHHVPGCDMERCPKCGMQLISCGCFVKFRSGLNEDGDPIDESTEYFDEEEFAKYPTEKWSGIGYEKEMLLCEQEGWYNYFDYGWIRCSADHPEASHDINRAVIRLVQQPNYQL